jgi:PIN domain nuclease of toxin-antitoxin system
VRLLLDTHTLAWWIRSNPLLSTTARNAIATDGNDIIVSVASAWEIAIKVGKGKWPEAARLLNEFETAIADENFSLMSIEVPHVRAAGLIVAAHRDPFDRLLAAQAVAEGLTLVTADPHMPSLGTPVLW